MSVLPPEIQQVEVLRIEPGDRLIVHLEKIPDRDARTVLVDRLQATLDLPSDVRIVFASGDISLQVLHTEPEPNYDLNYHPEDDYSPGT